MIKNEEIWEIKLNPAFCNNNDLQSLINQGFQASFMTDEELNDGDTIYEILIEDQ